MKIHIVQKGDTLWEIAKQYGVDFNELIQMNTHLSSPDMIMPGMKIRIPVKSKQVKKESKVSYGQNEVKKQVKKDVQPIQETKEEAIVKPKETKLEMPKDYMTKLPVLPTIPEVPQIKEKEKVKMKEEVVMEEVKDDQYENGEVEMPYPSYEAPHYTPHPMPLPQPMPMPCVNKCGCHFVFHPCHHHHNYKHHKLMPMGPMVQPGFMGPPPMPMHPMPTPNNDCGCQGNMALDQQQYNSFEQHMANQYQRFEEGETEFHQHHQPLTQDDIHHQHQSAHSSNAMEHEPVQPFPTPEPYGFQTPPSPRVNVNEEANYYQPPVMNPFPTPPGYSDLSKTEEDDE